MFSEGFIPPEGKGLLKIYPLATSREQDAIYFLLETNHFHCSIRQSLNNSLWEKNLSLYVFSWVEDLVVRLGLKKYRVQNQTVTGIAPSVSL